MTAYEDSIDDIRRMVEEFDWSSDGDLELFMHMHENLGNIANARFGKHPDRMFHLRENLEILAATSIIYLGRLKSARYDVKYFENAGAMYGQIKSQDK